MALRGTPDWEITWLAAKGDVSAGAIVADQWPPFVPWVLLRLANRLPVAERWRVRLGQIVAERGLLRMVARIGPDLVYLHNLHDACSFSFVERLPRNVPLVWQLHDLWPLTGYCCYPVACEKYTEGCCGECPQWDQWGTAPHAPAWEWARRDRFYRDNAGRITFVGPSQWIVECAARRFPGCSAKRIPNAVDVAVFHPVRPQAAVRQALGLPADRPIVLAVSDWLDNPVKGITTHLVGAMERVRRQALPACMVVAVGHLHRPVALPDNWRVVGRVQDAALLNLYYNAADVFVCPSLAENFGQVLLESQAAGAPTVVFDEGGCPEIVRDGATGFVARNRDAASLAEGIQRVLSMTAVERENLSRNCRGHAEATYSLDVVIPQYRALLMDLLEGARR